jgi:hypothetical protein
MTEGDDDISYLAMEIMAAVDSGNGLPRKVSYRDMQQLSEYECLAIDRAIRKRGRVLERRSDEDEFTIRNHGHD